MLTTPPAADAPPREPGRFCPADYGLGPRAFASQPWLETDCLYVAGGLYGNTVALEALNRLFNAEATERRDLVFNGDFHWFDVDAAEFTRIEHLTAPHHRLRGNVETEIARPPPDDDAGDTVGCGCAYPADVGDDIVERSNQILSRLRATAHRTNFAAALGHLPMVARARVGGLGVAITHGDEQSLAGWRLAHDRISDSWRSGLAQCLRACDTQIIASSHTCLAVAQTYDDTLGRLAAINNGAAGLANFAGSHTGLVTRIARDDLRLPAGAREVYTCRMGAARVSALAIDFDLAAWLTRFDAQWPDASDAAVSYRHRVIHGTTLTPASAARGHFQCAV